MTASGFQARCHRKRSPTSNQYRPIIVKFEFYEDRQCVWKAKNQFKGCRIFVNAKANHFKDTAAADAILSSKHPLEDKDLGKATLI